MLSSAQYARIKSQLDFNRAYSVTLAFILMDIGLIALGLWMVQSGNIGLFLLSQLLFATVFFHNFGLLHEAGHGNCSSKKWLNNLTGYYASVLCFTAYIPWKLIHQQHHVWAGTIDDPTARNIFKWRESKQVPGLIRLAWKSWIPLFAFMQHIVFWTYPLRLWKTDRKKVPACLFSTMLLPASYVALYLAMPDLFHPANFALAFVIYLFSEELVNLPHHIDLIWFEERLPLREQYKAARSCYYPKGLSEFFVLNFNFHSEHHLFPALPWFRLRSARALLREPLGDEYNEGVGISWNLDNRTKSMLDIIVGDHNRETGEGTSDETTQPDRGG